MALKFRDFYRPADRLSEMPEKLEVEMERLKTEEGIVVAKGLRAKELSERNFAVFAVGPEWFAIDLDSILEILHTFQVIAVPHLPDSFAGVISLRGESVPVINLQTLLKEPINSDSLPVCIISLVNETKIGFLVNSDVEIINLGEGRFYPLPDCYTKEETEFLEGIFWVGDRFIGILKPGQTLEVLIPAPSSATHAAEG